MKYLNSYNLFNEAFDINSIIENDNELDNIINKLNFLFLDLGLLLKFKKQQFIQSSKKEKIYNFYCCLINLDFPQLRNSLLGNIFNDLYHENWTRFNYETSRGINSIDNFKIVFTNHKYFINRPPSKTGIEIYGYPSNKDRIIPFILKNMLIGFEELSDSITTASQKTENLPYIRKIIIHYLKAVIKLNGNISEETKFKIIADSINSTDKGFIIYDLLKNNNRSLYSKIEIYNKNVNVASDMGGLGF